MRDEQHREHRENARLQDRNDHNGSGIAPEMEPKAIRLRQRAEQKIDGEKKHYHRDLGGRLDPEQPEDGSLQDEDSGRRSDTKHQLNPGEKAKLFSEMRGVRLHGVNDLGQERVHRAQNELPGDNEDTVHDLVIGDLRDRSRLPQNDHRDMFFEERADRSQLERQRIAPMENSQLYRCLLRLLLPGSSASSCENGTYAQFGAS